MYTVAEENGVGRDTEAMTAEEQMNLDFAKSVMKSIGSENAIKMSDSKWWEGMEPRKAAIIAISTAELCCPVSVFWEILSNALGRAVYTHEMVWGFKNLYLEIIGEKDTPTLQEIIELIPEEKRLVIQL
jgi:hypothetical protein